jgi:hypothetical protein
MTIKDGQWRISMEVKLTKSEIALFNRYREEFGTVMKGVQGLVNELLHTRIIELGTEKGIDFVNEDWKFDAQTFSFTKIEPPKPATPEIPKKKGSTKKKKPVVTKPSKETVH